MGIAYTISQIVIMTFLGILMFSAFGTGGLVLGLVIPLMILGIPSVGVSNWWLFRGLVAKTLIILRDMFRTPTDVPFTLWEKFKLTIVAIICCISGFIAAYAFYLLVDSLMLTLLEFLGWGTFFTAAAVASPWLVPLLLGIIILPIFILSAIAVASYFYRAAYEPILRGRAWQDIKDFFSALFTYGAEVDKKFDRITAELRAHYGQYYQGAELTDKVNAVVEDSSICTLLKQNKSLTDKAITIRGVVTTLLVFILIPGMIGGIIATQLLSHANLSAALHWVGGFANLLSWGICAIAGIAYTPVLVSGGAKCVVDIVFKVEKSPKRTITLWGKGQFQWVRGWNSFLNFLEGAVGYILKKADKITDFASQADKVLHSAFDVTLGTYLTVSAGAGSFLVNSIQGPPTTYEEDRDTKRRASTSTAIELQTCRQEEEAVVEETSALSTVLPSWKNATAKPDSSPVALTLSPKLAACNF